MDGLATGIGLFAVVHDARCRPAAPQRAACARDGTARRRAARVSPLQLQSGVDLPGRLRQPDHRLRAGLLCRALEPEVGDAAGHDGAVDGAGGPAPRHGRVRRSAVPPAPADLQPRPQPSPSPAARPRLQPTPGGAVGLRRLRRRSRLLAARDLAAQQVQWPPARHLLCGRLGRRCGWPDTWNSTPRVTWSLTGTFRHIVNARLCVDSFERKAAAAVTPTTTGPSFTTSSTSSGSCTSGCRSRVESSSTAPQTPRALRAA